MWAQSQPSARNAKKGDELFRQGLKAEQSGRPEEARSAYEKAVTADIGCGEAWLALGRIQASHKELDAARKSFEAAIKAQPARTDSYFEAARLEQQEQNWKGLIDICERLLRVNRTDLPEAYLLCANGYFKTGNLDLAEERVSAGLKIDARQQFPKLHELLGWIQVERGNAAGAAVQQQYYEAAAGEFRRYLKVAPPNAHSAEIQATLNEIEGGPVSGSIASGEAEATKESPGLTLRSTVTLIQMDVVAQDREGRPVEDLRQEEFNITDNGKQRQIATFAVEKAAMGESLRVAPTESTPAARNVFNNLLGQRAKRSGYAIILMDWFNTGVPNIQSARQDALKVLRGRETNGSIALYSLDSTGLKIVNEFGSSQAELVKSIGSLSGLAHPCHAMQLTETNLRGPGAAKKSPTQATPETLCDDPDIPKQQAEFLMKARIQDTLKALEAIADHLSGVPGRKSLIWISAGVPTVVINAPLGPAELSPQTAWEKFTEDFDALFRKLNNAGVSVYPVDARGLPVSQLYDDPRFPGSAIIQFTTPIMDEFATRTGGTAFHGRNNLDEGIKEALADSGVTYLLGYYVPQDEPNRGFHKIVIKVNREGVKLRHREGYSVETATTPEDRNAQLSRAALAAVDATGIPIEITAERRKNALTLSIGVKPGSLGLAHVGNRWRGSIDVATEFVAEKPGTSYPLQFETTELDLSEERYAAGEREGLLFPKTLEIPAGADRVKVLARSGEAGRVGSVTIRLKDIVN